MDQPVKASNTNEHIVSQETEITLRILIRSLSDTAHIPVFQLKQDGTMDWEHLPRLCSFFDRDGPLMRTCPAIMTSAAETSVKIQEPYMFLTPCEMLMFACPSGGRKENVIFVGPVAMGTDKDETIKSILSHFADNPSRSVEALSFLWEGRVWTTPEISGLYRILLHFQRSLANLHGSAGSDGAAPAEKTSEEYELPYTSIDYPEDPQGEVLRHILAFDTPAAMESFRLFYEKHYLMASGNLDIVRMQMIEMFNYICTRMNSDYAINCFLENLPRLSAINSFNDAYTLAEELIRNITEGRSGLYDETLSGAIPKAMKFINQNYDQSITLPQVAGHVHLAPTYFSALFKKETGKTFSQVLTDVRLANACHLLRNTDRSITDIATMSGFSSQSYFIRVFRRSRGKTPRQYRMEFSS